jgi:hypothetical protein
MVAPDWLDRDVIACLEEKCGSLVSALTVAYDASGGEFGELHGWGVRDLSTFGPPPDYGANVYIPEGRERFVWERVVEYHGCERRVVQQQPAEPELDLGGTGYTDAEIRAQCRPAEARLRGLAGQR